MALQERLGLRDVFGDSEHDERIRKRLLGSAACEQAEEEHLDIEMLDKSEVPAETSLTQEFTESTSGFAAIQGAADTANLRPFQRM